ncbi:ABC transporter substrate-binding protein [Salinirubrum litoreum]|uniref:ABC transporter substrate-binding protein n=1 Tax=Salinirubrum litoreum TaxID=1126234 RepID=A0ABD5RFU8_9EURY|nr:ABC transporter substrate-binding protein [Salinirubrum litoreum]
MSRQRADHDAPTRRAYLRYGAALAGGGLLAGCTGASEEPTEPPTESPSDSETETPTETATEADTETNESYSVTLSPAGTVQFTEPPSNVMVYSLLYADMAVAYGHGDAVNSLGFSAEAGGNTLDAYYGRLDGVSFDREGLAQLNTGSGNLTVDRELFYELDSDLHLVDPALVVSFDDWSVSDVETIEEEVAPWFGNVYSRNNTEPPAPYAGDYDYYTLWELAETVAEVFQERQRYEQLRAVHDDLLTRIESDLPPEDDRPTVASVIYVDETFYPFRSDTPGFANAHVRPLGAPDAFTSGDVSYESAYDFETMLEIDPEVILHRFGVASYYDVNEIRQTLAEHPIGGQLTAVETDRVYPSGNPLQGPLMNLFQLEMTAKQLYPEQFGAWPDYDGGAYPEIPPEERLFDRERVAEIVSGDA